MRFFFSLTVLLAMAIMSLAATTNEQSPYNTPGGNCEHGVDVHDKVSLKQFKCLKNKNFNYAIIRAERPDCKLDPYVVDNIKNAWSAGFNEVDVYLFPSFTCGLSAHAQMSSILTHLQKENALFGRVWLDVESSGSKWSLNPEENRKWLREAVQTIKQFVGNNNDRIGIYTSRYGWSPVVSKWEELAPYKLWYANYDNNPHLDKDTLNGGFGGWKLNTGFMKQYNGDIKKCGVDLDVNIRRGENAQCYNLGLFYARQDEIASPPITTINAVLVENGANIEAEQEAEALVESESNSTLEAEAENEAENENENENENEAEIEGEAEAENEVEGEVALEDALENELSTELPSFTNDMINQANEAELHAVLLSLEAEEATAMTRPILPAPPKEEKIVKGLTMVTYDQSKGSKGQNTVTNEIMKPKPVKCDPKKSHAHCDCKLDGPSPFVPVVA